MSTSSVPCIFSLDVSSFHLKLPMKVMGTSYALKLMDHYNEYCSACGEGCCDVQYRCGEEGFNFFLCCRFLTRPLKVQHKFDEHPLKLTYEDPNKHDNPLQHICWICEDRRDPQHWFYHCDECDFDAHTECVLGEYPYIKRGSFYTHIAIFIIHTLSYFSNVRNIPTPNVINVLSLVKI
ncbi:hypothetical protein SLA2020_246160 [Shorea laevis]